MSEAGPYQVFHNFILFFFCFRSLIPNRLFVLLSCVDLSQLKIYIMACRDILSHLVLQ